MNLKSISVLILLLLFSIGSIAFWLLPANAATRNQDSDLQSSIVETDHTLENTIGRTNNFIETLRNREFTNSEIKIEKTLDQKETYTSYLISYLSDGLTIYGVLNIPQGEGPFPVIVLNHGYYNPSTFKSGDGTRNIADVLTPEGYITIASDYRGHGNSDNDVLISGGHRPEYAVDVLNLVASLNSITQADTTKIGMWGHSMGGEISLRNAEVVDTIKAIVLWAPTSADAADNLAYYGGEHKGSIAINPSLKMVSPINYLSFLTAPISIHQGLEDTEVKPEWSRELNSELKKEGKKVDYFEYEGQDHNFRNLGWDLVSERTIIFYDTYLK